MKTGKFSFLTCMQITKCRNLLLCLYDVNILTVYATSAVSLFQRTDSDFHILTTKYNNRLKHTYIPETILYIVLLSTQQLGN